MPSDLGLTRHDLLTDAAQVLATAAIGEARREALRIWTGLDREASAAMYEGDARVAADRRVAFLSAVRRRAAGEPLAHVTGWAGFRHLTLRSDRRALIPRPETEGLVELVLSRVRTGRVADIGTGTGCIALSLATEGGFDQVIATDLSAEALALAESNRRDAGARIALVRGDLAQPIRSGSLDALVSNPPYLTAEEYAGLDGSVRQWEPALALVGGPDGLSAIARLLDEGRRVLRPGGWLALEIDVTRAAQCAARAGASGWRDVAVHADLFGRERYLLARRSDAP